MQSATAPDHRWPGPSSSTSRTDPFSVNLMALPSRLNRICRKRTGSPITRSGTSSATDAGERQSLGRCLRQQRLSSPSISSAVESSSRSRSRRPASIFEKSRMSSMILSNEDAE